MRRLLQIWLLLLLSGCAFGNAQPRPADTRAADLPVSAQSTATPSTRTLAPAASSSSPDSTWHTLYTRPGFDAASSIDLRAVGDVSLARNIEPLARRHEPGWLLEPTAELLRGDLAVGNLESPLTTIRRPDALRPGPYRLPADPALVDRLAPFSALSLANNHALDAESRGLVEAQQTLATAGIVPLGLAGSCGATEDAPTKRGLPLRLLAFNAVPDPHDRADEAERCGRAWLDDAALEQVARLRQAAASPIVVLVHWGDEYAPTPSDEQRDWGRRLVAAGADLIVGSHPHVVQPAEMVEAEGRRGFVAYSLGNFVFDQPGQSATSHAVVLRALLDQAGVGAVAVAPVALRNGQPVPLTLDDPAAQAQIAALTPLSDTQRAWRWDGARFVEMAVPPGTSIPPASSELAVDLRSNGEPLRVTLDAGQVQVLDGDTELWRNEMAAWQIAGMAAGDADNDGRNEVLLRLWKPDKQGVLRSHPFMLGWRGGYYRIFWGGSAVAQPIQDAAIGPVSDSRNALVVLEGGRSPGDTATHVGVWTWQGWNFQQQWQSPAGVYQRLVLLDLDGDSLREIVVE